MLVDNYIKEIKYYIKTMFCDYNVSSEVRIRFSKPTSVSECVDKWLSTGCVSLGKLDKPHGAVQVVRYA
jgi:hypothetical protein